MKKHQAMFVVTLADSEVQAEWQRGIGLPRSQLSQRLPERLLCPTTQLRGMDSASNSSSTLISALSKELMPAYLIRACFLALRIVEEKP